MMSCMSSVSLLPTSAGPESRLTSAMLSPPAAPPKGPESCQAGAPATKSNPKEHCSPTLAVVHRLDCHLPLVMLKLLVLVLHPPQGRASSTEPLCCC